MMSYAMKRMMLFAHRHFSKRGRVLMAYVGRYGINNEVKLKRYFAI
jgi:hypothetical protein